MSSSGSRVRFPFYCFFILLFSRPCFPFLYLQSPKDQTIYPLEEVLKDPTQYDGKLIKVSCYYYESFEKVIIATNIMIHENGWIWIQNGEVWASWSIVPPKDVLNKLKHMPGIGGENIILGYVIVEGIFRKESKSGHMGNYPYNFEIQKMRIHERPIIL